MEFASHRCSWASPAVGGGLVYETFLDSSDCGVHTAHPSGEVVAFAARTGRVRWSRRLAPTESSPLLADGLVLVGDWDGNVTALDAKTGRTHWVYRADGAGEGLARARRRTGVRRFLRRARLCPIRAHRRARVAGFRAAALRLLGAVLLDAGGRVRPGLPRLDRRQGLLVRRRDGKLRWSHSTGGYVYSSPAVWRRLVLVGSYDGSFYALDAATGDVRWRFRANGPISGSATVIAGIVYFSTLRERTYGLDARTGRLVWSFPDGKYSPIVADAKRIYLVGLGRLYGLVPAAS